MRFRCVIMPILKIGAGLGFLLLLLMLGGLAWLNSTAGRDAALNAAIGAASNSGLQLTLDGVDGGLLHELKIAHVTVTDRDGAWLEASDVALGWDPWQLLVGRLHVTEITAGAILLERTPMLNARASEAHGTSFYSTPPLNVDVARVAVAELSVAEAAFGHKMTMQLDANASMARGNGSIGLHVRRLDAPGVLDLDARFDVAADVLVLDLRAEDNGEGGLAKLVGVSGSAPVQFDLSGEGPLSDWRGHLKVEIDHKSWATLAATVTGRTSRVVLLDGHFGTAPLIDRLPEDLAEMIGPQVAIVGKAVIDRERLRVEHFAIDTNAVSFSLNGDYGLNAGDWTAAASLLKLSPDIGRYLGFAADQASVTLEGRHAGGRTEAVLRAKAAQFEFEEVTIDGVSVTLNATRGPSTAPWQLGATLDGERVAFAGKLAKTNEALNERLSLTARGELDSSQAVKLDELQISLGSLNFLAAGQYQRHQVEGHQAAGQWSLDIPDLAAIIPTASDSSRRRLRLAGRLTYTEFLGVRFDDIELDLPGGLVTGQLSLNETFSHIDAGFSSTDLNFGDLGEAFGLPVTGRLDLMLAMRGELSDPGITASAKLHEAMVAGNAVPPAEISATIDRAFSHAQGHVQVVVHHSPQASINLATRFTMPNAETINLQSVKIAGPGISGGGDLALSLDRALANGRITLDASDLSPLFTAAGLRGSGRAKVQISLDGSKTNQLVEASGVIAGVAIVRSDEQSVRIADGNIVVKGGLTGNSAIAAKIAVNGVRAGGVTIAHVGLSANGRADRLTFALEASTPDYDGIEIALAGTVRTERHMHTIRLTQGRGKAQKRSFTIAPGTTLVAMPGSYELRAFRIFGPDVGETEVEGSFKADAVEGRLVGRRLPLGMIGVPKGERRLLGEIDVSATVSGTVVRPNGHLTLVARNLALDGDKKDRQANATAELSIDGKAAVVRMSVTNLSDEPLIADASIVRGVRGLGFDGGSAVSGRLSWRGTIGELTRFAPLVGQDVSGGVAARLTLSGELGSPTVTGSIVVSDGAFADYATGLSMRVPRLEIAGQRGRLELQPFEAFDPSGGKVTGHGMVDLDREANFPFNLELNLARAQLLNRADVMAALSGNIKAEGSLAKAMVTGTLQSDRIEVNLDAGLPPNITTIEVEEIPEERHGRAIHPRAEARGDESRSALGNTGLSIRLTMPGRVFVRGRGLDSEWEGDLAVSETIAKPRVKGTLTSRRGQFDVVGKTFKLQASSIDLTPKADGSVDALLNISAVSETNDLSVTVRLTGEATAPTIALSSNPSMPQDEILSRLLFGKSRASLTPVEALQLVQALRSLSGGGGGGLGLMTKLRRTLGVDVLRVDGGGADGAAPALEAGKYISDRVYVGVKQGAAPESSAVTVDVEVLNNLSVGSEVRQDGGSRVGVKYKWDY